MPPPSSTASCPEASRTTRCSLGPTYGQACEPWPEICPSRLSSSRHQTKETEMTPNTTITRRSLLGLVSVGAVAGALTACAGPGGSTTSTTAASSAAPALDASKASGNISFAHWRAEDKVAFDKIITAFKAKYAGTDVRQDLSLIHISEPTRRTPIS